MVVYDIRIYFSYMDIWMWYLIKSVRDIRIYFHSVDFDISYIHTSMIFPYIWVPAIDWYGIRFNFYSSGISTRYSHIF